MLLQGNERRLIFFHEARPVARLKCRRWSEKCLIWLIYKYIQNIFFDFFLAVLIPVRIFAA